MPEIDRRLSGSEMVDGKLMIHSLSGHERNHLFLNQAGKQFEDVSAISGIDNPADSRGFVLLDYDRDGQQDIALVNANDPLLNLYRNQFDAIVGQQRPNRFIAIRFQGGNLSPEPSSSACRDGYGAVAIVKVGDAAIKREHRCGEGYGTQNSSTMIVGIGRNEHVDSVQVRWPSGKTTHTGKVPAGKLLTLTEGPQDGSPSFHVADYLPVPIRKVSATSATAAERLRLNRLDTLPPLNAADTRPRLYLTMATWCVACIEHLPHVEHLLEVFGDEVQIVGLPIDPADDEQKLQEYAARVGLPYALALRLDDEQRAAINNALVDIIPSDAVPASIITTADGRVLTSMAGIPSVSELRKALERDVPATEPGQ